MSRLLLGMGNPILCDDAVGVRLAASLAPKLRGRPGLTILEECSVGGLGLLDILEGFERVVVVDSVRTQEGVPGDWYHWTESALRPTEHLTNIHDVNFATALRLGRALGLALPEAEQIHIFAVEVEDNRSFSEQMTPKLEQVFPALSAAIYSEVAPLLE